MRRLTWAGRRDFQRTVYRNGDAGSGWRWFVACRALHYTEELTGGGEVGIDLGLTHFATLSTGEKIENPRHLRSGRRSWRGRNAAWLARRKDRTTAERPR